jgi:tetratricopeptide (TPR) repeat protein
MRTLKIIVLILFFFLGNDITASAQRKKDKKDKSSKTEQKSVLTESDSMQVQFLFFNGLKEKTLGNFDVAQEYFKKALTIDQMNDGVMYELAQTYAAQRKLEEALFFFKEAYKINPKNEWYLMNAASVLEEKRDYKEAAVIYQKLIQLKPDHIDFYFDYASMLLYDNKFEEAIKVYDQIQSKIGISEDVSVQKEKIYLRLGKTDKAITEVTDLVNSNPKEVKYLMILGDVYIANAMPEKALEVYHKILELDPSSAYAQLSLADYYRTKGDESASYEMLLKAFGNRFVDIDTKVRIISPYFNMMNDTVAKAKAFQLAKLMVETHPEEAKAYAVYGDFLYQDKQSGAAKIQYEKTLVYDKKVFAVWQNLMFIYAELQDYETMQKQSEEALTLFPNQVILFYFNGTAKFQNKKYPDAVTAYQNGLALGTDNKELEAQMYANLGDAFHSLEKNKESDEAYETSLKLKPNNAFVLNNYAYYLSLRGESLERAEKMSKQSNEIDLNNSSFQDTYAWILYKLNRFEDAKIWIEKSMKNGGDKSSTVVEHYGDILFKLGLKDLAVSNWQKAKEYGSDSSLLNKKITDKKLYE